MKTEKQWMAGPDARNGILHATFEDADACAWHFRLLGQPYRVWFDSGGGWTLAKDDPEYQDFSMRASWAGGPLYTKDAIDQERRRFA